MAEAEDAAADGGETKAVEASEASEAVAPAETVEASHQALLCGLAALGQHVGCEDLVLAARNAMSLVATPAWLDGLPKIPQFEPLRAYLRKRKAEEFVNMGNE